MSHPELPTVHTLLPPLASSNAPRHDCFFRNLLVARACGLDKSSVNPRIRGSFPEPACSTYKPYRRTSSFTYPSVCAFCVDGNTSPVDVFCCRSTPLNVAQNITLFAYHSCFVFMKHSTSPVVIRFTVRYARFHTRSLGPNNSFEASFTPQLLFLRHQTTRSRRALDEIFQRPPFREPTAPLVVEQSSFEKPVREGAGVVFRNLRCFFVSSFAVDS